MKLVQRRQWQPTAVLLPGKSHGQRSLVGCSPWGRKESDMTEQLHFHFSLSCIGEGNGSPLQCSCLENPRDGGAWWAAVYGVAQSQTRLKWLSSSSSETSQRLFLYEMNMENKSAGCHRGRLTGKQYRISNWSLISHTKLIFRIKIVHTYIKYLFSIWNSNWAHC